MHQIDGHWRHNRFTERQLDAGAFIQTCGGAIAAGARYEPNLVQTGPLYSYVAANTTKAHVKVG